MPPVRNLAASNERPGALVPRKEVPLTAGHVLGLFPVETSVVFRRAWEIGPPGIVIPVGVVDFRVHF